MCYTPYVFLLLLLLLHLYTVESGSQTWSTEAPNPAWKHTWDKNRHVQCKAMYSVTADPVKLNQTAAFMWKLAREQVGLSAESDCSSQILIVHDFSFMQTRANNGRAVNYVHMWKGESENICRNILSFAPARDDGTSIHHTFTPFTRASWERDADDGQEEEELNTFTFVRHPLARFEDAMRQYLWQCADGLGLRNYRRTTGHSIGEQRRTVDSDFIVKDIDRLLCSCQLRRCPGNTHPHTPHYHILPQATVLASYIKGEKGPNPTFVGHIESLEEDWAAITDHFEVDHSFIGRRRGNSNSTLTETPASASPSLSPLSATKDDHYRLVEGLAELYTHKPEYLRALCVLYFFDFYCFDYEFPAECAEVKQNMTTYLVRNGLF